jgi:hypothetical protein
VGHQERSACRAVSPVTAHWEKKGNRHGAAGTRNRTPRVAVLDAAAAAIVLRDCQLAGHDKKPIPAVDIAGDVIAYTAPDSTYAVTKETVRVWEAVHPYRHLRLRIIRVAPGDNRQVRDGWQRDGWQQLINRRSNCAVAGAGSALLP